MADNATISLRICEMESDGNGGYQIPAAAHFQGICHTGVTLNAGRQTQQSEKICGTVSGSRGRQNPTPLGLRPAGGWNSEWEFNQLPHVARGYMANDWRKRLNNRTNRYGTTQISSVTSTDVNVTAGTDFAASQVVYMDGFTNSANNGVKLISAGDGDSYQVLGLVAEASPPVTAEVRVVGLAVASGSIVMTAASAPNPATLQVVSQDWSAYLLGAGDWFKLGKVGWCRVESIAGDTLSLDVVPEGYAGGTFLDNYDGYLWFGDTIRDGRTKVPYVIEQGIVKDSGDVYYVYWPGLYLNTGQFSGSNTDSAQVISGSFAFSGIEKPIVRTVAQGRWPGAVTVPGIDTRSYNTGSHVDLLLEDGKIINAADAVTTVANTLNHNVAIRGAQGFDAGSGIRFGDFDPSGNVDAYLDDEDRFSYLIESGQLSLTYALKSPDFYGLLWDMPNMEYTGGTQNTAGRNNDATLSLPYNGYVSDDDYTTQLQLHYAVDATVTT